MNNRRVAIVAGCRTPFARSGTVYRDLTAVDLGTAAVRELLERTEVDPAAVGTVVMGQVVPSVKAPNLAPRGRAAAPACRRSVPAHTVNRACASANQAIADVASAILLGHVDAGIAGGAESLSDVPDPPQQAHGAGARRGAAGAHRSGARLGAFARAAPAGPRARRRRRSPSPRPASRWASPPRRWRRRTASRGEEQDRDRARVAPERLRARPRTAGCRPRRCAVLRAARATRPRSPPTTCSAGTPRWRRSRRCRRPSTSATARVTAGNSSPLTDGARRGAADVRGQGPRRGPRAARLRPLLGGRGGGPRRAAADGPRARDTEGARARRHRARRTST